MLRFAFGRWAIDAGRGAVWGTLLANVLACALLGYLTAQGLKGQLADQWRWLLAAGFCGGFSTFSTFSLEAVTMLQDGRPMAAALYVALSVLLGVGVIYAFVWRTT